MSKKLIFIFISIIVGLAIGLNIFLLAQQALGVTFAGPPSMGGNKITSLGTPTSSGDAVTMNYVNSASVGNADTVDGHHFHWSGQGGQPTWLWGGNDSTNMYVYNPSNFSVNYAGSAGSAGSATYLSPITGPSSYRLAYSADSVHDYAGGWGRIVMHYTGDNKKYGVRVDRADYASEAGSAGNTDTIDGIDSSQFFRLDTGNTVNGQYTYFNYPPTASHFVLGDATGVLGAGYPNTGITMYRYNYIYPGRVDGGSWQGSWFLGSHGSYGLYSNTGLYLEGSLTMGGNLEMVASHGKIKIVPPAGGSTSLDLCLRSTDNAIATCASLAEFKENIKDLELGLDTIMELTPREFDWIEETDNEHDLGLVAEEVEAISPLLVTYFDGELTGVKYRQMVALLVKAIQELEQEKAQQEEVEELKQEIETLRAIINK